jgi:hypothetical protein
VLGPFNSGTSSSFSGNGSTTETYAATTTWNEDFNLTFAQGSTVGSCIDINVTAACPAVPVPGPIAGAGIPGLILASGGLLGWWRRKRRVEAVL